MADLVFQFPPGSTNLVFGEGFTPPVEDAPVTVLAPLEPEVSVTFVFNSPVTVSVSLEFGVFVHAEYISGASRPTVAELSSAWQAGATQKIGVRQRHHAAVRLPVPAGVRHQQAVKTPVGARTGWDAADPIRNGYGVRAQQGAPLSKRAEIRHQDGVPVRNGYGVRFQQGDAVRSGTVFRHQDGLRDRRARVIGRHQDGLRDQRVGYHGSVEKGLPLASERDVRFQQAMKPLPGIWDREVPEPPEHVCYTPDPDLVFIHPWDGSPNLLFICDDDIDGPEVPPALVVVPVRRVYMVINETSLWRVATNSPIPCFSMSLSLDVDSWTWSFSASLPAAALADLEPVDGIPVELEARINGSNYRVIAEGLSRERVFGNARTTVRGRGKSALLDTPYAPERNYGNDETRTAQQLMADVLTENGVGIGWDVAWASHMEDWSVPGGAWSGQGSYIKALNEIAASVGAYIQPHRTLRQLVVRHRYPFAPWDWATEVSPNFELPAAVTTREGIEWVEKARYNQVFVSGSQVGILADVRRAGTTGGALAPMVTDALITATSAARQRGRAVLSDTGRQANVSLRLPVLELTGVIEPGNFVRYVDGGVTRLGIVRSTSVEVQGLANVWQQILVETHV